MKIPEPRDMLGNKLSKDDLVDVHFGDRPLVFKVIAVESGGLSTPNGVTPALVRIVSDITLRLPPGMPFSQLARVVTPQAEQLIADVLDRIPDSIRKT